MKNVTTSQLWDIAHNNLCAKRWAVATQALETLAQRRATSDILASASEYGAPEHLQQFLQDRIDACNRYV